MRIIAGPCSVESKEQLFRTAVQLKEIGITTIRAGIWKPRSRINSFEGVGSIGLEWIREIKEELGVKVYTEVGLPKHIEEALASEIDGIWIGARSVVSPFLVNELASALEGIQIPVWIKNPVSPDIDLWIGAIERFQAKNIHNISLIHRGFTVPDSFPYRNKPLWEYVEKAHLHFPDLPLFLDPSHICGNRALIAPTIEEALSEPIPYTGLFIESHCCPEHALSDAQQQLSPSELKRILTELSIIK